jgi:hypothetical protein
MTRYIEPQVAGPCCKGDSEYLPCTANCKCANCAYTDLFNDALEMAPLTVIRIGDGAQHDPVQGMADFWEEVYKAVVVWANEEPTMDPAAALDVAVTRVQQITAVLITPDGRRRDLPCVDGSNNRLTAWDYPHGFNCPGCGYPSHEEE